MDNMAGEQRSGNNRCMRRIILFSITLILTIISFLVFMVKDKLAVKSPDVVIKNELETIELDALNL